MALINNAKKEINAKIIYFGPPGCGKSTALSYIYSRIKPALRGELKRVPAGGDNLLFFDFSPFDTLLPDGYHVRLHVYTLTGSVTNPATWKMTLKGADGIVIMVDAAHDRLTHAQESVSLLRDYLSAYGVGLHDTPAILLLNDSADSIRSMDDREFAFKLDLPDITICRSISASGEGVLDAVTRLSRQVLDRVAATENRFKVAESHPVVGNSYEQESSGISVCSSAQAPEIAVSQAGPTEMPMISVVSRDVCVEGTVVRIPLEVSFGKDCRRLVISVSVDPQ